ncbi:hypothetical protein ASPCADRAFT_166660 [Aspergillus carbonarius ITEM 5010]|uniref:Cytochrome P450 n=1 Tax=Aspergillus carbonarius (strain ITEM 5010) TaxID=602072 RepID=A0A1R3RT34_ASPC5|nr:hypothetical protein ASPCADRAFT_166660 [Aspergillus carbonarius ITEM 5010]
MIEDIQARLQARFQAHLGNRDELLASPSIVAATLLCVLVLFQWRRAGGAKAFPTPRLGLPLIGDALAFLNSPVGFVKDATNKCGPIFQVKLLFANIVYLRGTQLNRMYVDVKEDIWSFGGGIGMFLKKIAIPGYFEHFRTLVGSLNRGINRKVTLDRYTELAGEEADKALLKWSQQPDVKIFEEASKYVHRVIVRTLMGQDFYDHHIEELYDLLHRMEDEIGHPLNLLLPDWVSHPPARRLGQARDRFAEIFEQQMAIRRQNPEQWKGSLDYITYTLEDPRTAHLQEYYPSHHTVLMFAAHTSTVASIAWTAMELIRNPQYVDAIRQSFKEHGDVHQSPELLACVKESGRHYSGVHMYRTTHRPVKLEDGYTVPENWVVCTSPYLTHHDADIYQQPDRWLPERWLRPTARLQNLNNATDAAFLQFGAGSHRCPGENMAGIIARELVSRLVKNYDFQWGRQGPAQLDIAAMDFSKVGSPWLRGDARIRLQPRKSTAA